MANELLKLQNFEKLNKVAEEEWSNFNYEKKILLTRYIFKALLKNDEQGGSYRNLIYNCLDFNNDAYSFLLPGMEVKNRMDDDYDLEI